MSSPIQSDARRTLRVGLLVDGLVLSAWLRLMLERIRATPCAEIVLVVVGAPRTDESTPRRGLAAATRAALERWAVAERVDPDAFAAVDISAVVTDVPRLTAARRHIAAAVAEYADDDVEQIARYNLDVLVDLGTTRLTGKILSSARHGVWAYSRSSGPAGFWELAEGRAEIRTSLELDTATGARTLYASSSSVERTSLAASRNRAYWKAASFVPRTLERLDREGAQGLAPGTHELPGMQSIQRTPGIQDYGVFLARRFLERKRARVVGILSREQWVLLYAFGATTPENFGSFEQLTPPPDRFWADPHIVTRDGRHYVFLEEYLYATHRAHISVFALDPHGTQPKPVPIIERPYHLSYPHVFSWGGELYMVPESKMNRTIEAYRCVEFPYVWEPATVLMDDVEAVDTTLLEHGGRWWLFANMVENPGGSSWDELFLFSADSPLSERWAPHPMNPIVSDVRRSRPAGPIFAREGRLYRPSQNSSPIYGYAFQFNEITELTATRYAERVVRSVEPNWDRSIFATHTFASEHGLTVIDGMRRLWRWP